MSTSSLSYPGHAGTAFFGLPEEVEFCTKCVISNQRAAPSVSVVDAQDVAKETVRFDDGVCDACRVVAQKGEIDWAEREFFLHKLLEKYRSTNSSYDCLVPGSGGKDSVYAAHLLKYKYGMNPLTVTWAPHMYTDVGWNNFQAWTKNGGFDNYLFHADGVTQRKLTLLAFKNLLHPFQPFTMGQRYFPAKLAKKFNIPLIFYGENAAEYGSSLEEGVHSKVPTRYLTNGGATDYKIGGVALRELQVDHGISDAALAPYLPLTENEFHECGIEAHYLGGFVPWVPQECYYFAVDKVGFSPNDQRTEGTYSRYNSIDDKLDGFHYWCGFVKFGIGRCTHEASQEVRHSHISRDEAVSLVRKYDGEFPSRFFGDVLDYLDLREDEFFEISDRFRSPHLWEKVDQKWSLRHSVS
ncbi:N-acetyl sugar amidotransferase [Paracoccaceae bacterium]|nr:N-acetyl sugar amidotransferase [Paracoccaceae bacterium]